jgi:glycosyltransferase involved in cell wall biosynthesis
MSVDFSVVIPTFRRPHQLAAAINSALNQRNVVVEIFVVDDSSEGSARDVVIQYNDTRLTYMKTPNPTGGFPSIVRNLAWPRATGAFVHFLDDDDVIQDEDYYDGVRDVFTAHPGVGLVFGRVEPFGDAPERQLKNEISYFTDAAQRARVCRLAGSRTAFLGEMLFGNALFVCSASIVRRHCLAHLGGFDPQIRLLEDADFHVRAIRKCGAYFVDRVAVRYRIGYPSLMHSPNPTDSQQSEERSGHRQLQMKYRRERGSVEFYALAVFARFIFPLLSLLFTLKGSRQLKTP